MTMKDYLAELRPGDRVVLDGTGGREISMVFTAREPDGTPLLTCWKIRPDGELVGAWGWRVRVPK
jgi:hypothetical protein